MKSKSIEARVFKPSDFRLPDKFGYAEVLGKCEFETIAEYIIKTSKEKGFWKPVSSKELYKLSEMIDKGRVDLMIKCGHLRRAVGGYLLTQRALEQIAKKYSA